MQLWSGTSTWLLENWASCCAAELCRAITIKVNTGASCIIKKHQASLTCGWMLASSYFKSGRSQGFLMCSLTCQLFHVGTWNSRSFISWAWWTVFFLVLPWNIIFKTIKVFYKSLWRVLFNSKLFNSVKIAWRFNTNLENLITFFNFTLWNFWGLVFALRVTLY